jgi:Flp pilus assembly protein TadG
MRSPLYREKVMFHRFFKIIKSIKGNTHGTTAIEFAMGLPIFLGFVAMVLEFPFMMYSNSTINRAAFTVGDAIRLDPDRVQTLGGLKAIACTQLFAPLSCSNLVVQVYPANGTVPTGMVDSYARSTTAAVPDIVIVRYEWPTFFPVATMSLGSTHELKAYAVAHAEPNRSLCGGVSCFVVP